MTSAPETPTTDEKARALKERIYASFTGLSILAALTAAGHATALSALVSVAVGIVGISAAGFLAEVVAHQVAHKAFPNGRELRTMAAIALGALGSAAPPLVLLALAAFGVVATDTALSISMGLYAATLVVIILLAAARSGLRPLQQLISAAMLVGLAALVVAVLLLAHLH